MSIKLIFRLLRERWGWRWKVERPMLSGGCLTHWHFQIRRRWVSHSINGIRLRPSFKILAYCLFRPKPSLCNGSFSGSFKLHTRACIDTVNVNESCLKTLWPKPAVSSATRSVDLSWQAALLASDHRLFTSIWYESWSPYRSRSEWNVG